MITDKNEVQSTDYDSNDQEVTDSDNSGDSKYSDSGSDSENYNQDPDLNPEDEEMPELLRREAFSDSSSKSESNQDQQGN